MQEDKKMKKFLIAAISLVMVFAFFGCGSGGSDSAEKEYIDQAEISKVFGDPDAYKGKYIKIAGQVFNTDRDGDTVAVQAWYDVENYEEDFIAYINSDESFKTDDFIIVDGVIEGTFSGENAFGGEIATVQINADSIEKSTYAEAIAPATETREVNKEVTEADATLTVSKVEFAESETRIYVELNNKSDYTVSAYTGSARIVQDGKQYDADYNYEADYPEIDDVSAGASKEGIICVKPLDPEKEITLHIDGYTENYDIDMEEFQLTF